MALSLSHEVPSRAGTLRTYYDRAVASSILGAHIFFVISFLVLFYSILGITDVRELRRHIEYGGSGHARLHRTSWLWVCPSTPATWSARSLFGMGRHVPPGGSQEAWLPRNSHPLYRKKHLVYVASPTHPGHQVTAFFPPTPPVLPAPSLSTCYRKGLCLKTKTH